MNERRKYRGESRMWGKWATRDSSTAVAVDLQQAASRGSERHHAFSHGDASMGEKKEMAEVAGIGKKWKRRCSGSESGGVLRVDIGAAGDADGVELGGAAWGGKKLPSPALFLIRSMQLMRGHRVEPGQ